MPIGVELTITREHSKENMMKDFMLENDEDWLDLPSEIYLDNSFT